MSFSTPMPSEIAAMAARWAARRDAGLSAVEREALDRWLAADPRHRTALAHYVQVLSVFEQPFRSGIAPQVLREMGVRAGRRRRRRITTVCSLAAAACVAMAASLWMRSPLPPRESRPAATAVAIRPEKQTLADGSTVELKEGALIAVSFTTAERRVELRAGEAHFQVAKEIARPFVVKVGDVEVRAVGTAFSVQFGPQAVEVLVTEGRVAMDTTADDASPAAAPTVNPAARFGAETPKVLVDAGNRAVVDVTTQAKPTATTVVAVTERELAERLAWRSPRLEFSGTPLAEAVDLMNRTNSQPEGRRQRLVIHSAARRLMEERVSGVFRADNPAAFARMLELSLGVRVETREDREIVLRK